MTEPADGSDAGVTIVELLLTIAIMGIAVVTIVGGMMTAVLGSDFNRKQSDLANVLRGYADSIAALPYQACTASYSPTYVPPTGYSVSITSTEYWDTASSTFIASCPATDYGFERLTLQGVTADGRASETLQVEKRVEVTGQTP